MLIYFHILVFLKSHHLLVYNLEIMLEFSQTVLGILFLYLQHYFPRAEVYETRIYLFLQARFLDSSFLFFH